MNKSDCEYSLGVLIAAGVAWRRHQIGMISQRINTLPVPASESLMAPADDRGTSQRFLPLRSAEYPPGSDNHHRIVQFARITQCIEHAVDLVIDIACCPAIFPCKCSLIAVVNVFAIERDTRISGLLVRSGSSQLIPLRGGVSSDCAYTGIEKSDNNALAIQRLVKAI